MGTKTEIVAARVSPRHREQFLEWARPHGGSSYLLRQFILNCLDQADEDLGKRAPSEHGVMARLRAHEHALLIEKAAERGMTPPQFVRALLLAHLTSAPQWNREEAETFRTMGEAIRQISILLGELDSEAAVALADRLQGNLMRELIAAKTGNMDYWNPPARKVSKKERAADYA